MWTVAACRWTLRPSRFAWSEGWRLPGAQSAFIRDEPGELWQWLAIWRQHQQTLPWYLLLLVVVIVIIIIITRPGPSLLYQTQQPSVLSQCAHRYNDPCSCCPLNITSYWSNASVRRWYGIHQFYCDVRFVQSERGPTVQGPSFCIMYIRTVRVVESDR